MKRYCVVYMVDGIHYRYRCYASSKREAKKLCMECMAVKKGDIVEVELEEY